MSRTRIVMGNYTKITGGNHNMYSEKSIITEAHGNIVENGKENGVIHGTPERPPVAEKTRIKSIICADELDDGSANDGSGTNTKKGALFNKSYRFEVKEFTNGEPLSDMVIKWAVSYTDPDTGQYTENVSRSEFVTGRSITLKFASNYYCGRNLTVKAYIENVETEGKLEVWMHNRFRWFDGNRVITELIERAVEKHSEKINQKGTSLCGIACIFYLFAKEKPNEYKDFAINLFRMGVAEKNSYVIKPNDEIFETKVDSKGFPEGTDMMPLVDFVCLAGTRSSENPNYKGGDQQVSAISWPNLMTKLCTEFLGYKKVNSTGIYNPIKPLISSTESMRTKIDEINNQIDQGYRMILMLDSDLIEDVWDISSLDLHWVVLESKITWDYSPGIFHPNKDEVMFKVYTWGTNSVYLKKPISWTHFMNNFNGYIKLK